MDKIREEHLKTDKAEIRRRVMALREALSGAERERAKILLTERILGHQWFYRSDTLLGFASYGSEIDTSEILKEALRLGKRVYLPRVTEKPENREMIFLQVHSLSELQPGYRGIPEPESGAEAYEYREHEAEQALMLMPGAVFDSFRNRIGYGAGFYDRYLADKPALQLRTIAVGFRCQMVGNLPFDEHDIRPYQVICV